MPILTPPDNLRKSSGTVNLLVRAVMTAIEETAKAKGLPGRVLSKINGHGQLVIALIVDADFPGQWDDGAAGGGRDAKKAARERR